MNKKTMVAAFVAIVVAYCILFDGSCFLSIATARESYENLKIFSDVLSIIQKNYVEETDFKQMVYDSIKGMVSQLDPHSSFMQPDMYKELQVETKGRFGGLGIEITIRDGILTVVSPIEDTPAFRAGIKTGDKIVKIQGEPTKSMSLMDAVKKMRGKPGTDITISISRSDIEGLKDFTITRDIIKITSVKSRLIEKKYGYVRIAQFQENTSNEFRKAMKQLTQDDSALQGLILDLRGNPGGLLDQAIKISDEFLDEGLIVYTEGRIDSQKMQFYAKKNSSPHDYPILVLVNAGSASASEIVAGALQDHGKAIIIGTPTFGKGTVQTIFPLSDGSGLRITTAKYYTPSHRSIQEKGIIPDITVDDSLAQAAPPQHDMKFMREKDLINHFKGSEGAKDDAQPETGAESGDMADSVAEKPDPSLDTALNILKGWELLNRPANGQSPQAP